MYLLDGVIFTNGATSWQSFRFTVLTRGRWRGKQNGAAQNQRDRAMPLFCLCNSTACRDQTFDFLLFPHSFHNSIKCRHSMPPLPILLHSMRFAPCSSHSNSSDSSDFRQVDLLIWMKGGRSEMHGMEKDQIAIGLDAERR